MSTDTNSTPGQPEDADNKLQDITEPAQDISESENNAIMAAVQAAQDEANKAMAAAQKAVQDAINAVNSLQQGN